MTQIPNPYEVLGVSEQATPEEIKQAFSKLARKYHPDRNPGDKKAEARFKEVSSARDSLLELDKKQKKEATEQQAEEERKEKERAKRRKEAKAKGIGDMFGGGQPKGTSNPQPQPPQPPPSPTTFTATATASVTETATVTVECPLGSGSSTVSATASVTATGSGSGTSSVSQHDAQLRANDAAARVAEANAKAAAEAQALAKAEQLRKDQEGDEARERAKRVTEATQFTQSQRRGVVVALLVTASIIGIVAAASSGGGSSGGIGIASTTSSKALQYAAAEEAARVRISGLSFGCGEGENEGHSEGVLGSGGPGDCKTLIYDYRLPIFISGIDIPFAKYLSAHGYTDRWTDSDHSIDAQSIGSNVPCVGYCGGSPFSWAHGGCTKPTNGEEEACTGSGLLYSPEGGAQAQGIAPKSLPKRLPWIIEWQLKDSQGKVVKRLRRSVKVLNCEEEKPFDTKEMENQEEKNAEKAQQARCSHARSEDNYN